MIVTLTDEQRQIARTARDMLAASLTESRLRELADARTYADDVWAELCELGWLGTAVPADVDGQELGMTELAIIAEQLGYALAPVPFLSSTAAILMIDRAGSADQREEWLPRLISGELRGTVAWRGGHRDELAPDAGQAGVVVLVDGDRARLLTRHELTAEPAETIDLTRRFGAVIPSDEGQPLPGDVAEGVAHVLVLLAAESVGVAQRALDMAVEYAKSRRQFGHPIGAYQAISHRCVQMLLDVEAGRIATHYAASLPVGSESALTFAAAAAAAAARPAGWRVPASALQIHGGIGFTWEHPIHLYMRRGRVNANLFGSTRTALEDVAGLALPIASNDRRSHP